MRKTSAGESAVDRFNSRSVDGGGESGNILHHVKREGKLSRGNCPQNMSGGNMSGSCYSLHDPWSAGAHWSTLLRQCLVSAGGRCVNYGHVNLPQLLPYDQLTSAEFAFSLHLQRHKFAYQPK